MRNHHGVEIYIDGEAHAPGHLDAQVDDAMCITSANAGIKPPPRAAVGLNDLLGGNVSELRDRADEAALDEERSAESALPKPIRSNLDGADLVKPIS